MEQHGKKKSRSNKREVRKQNKQKNTRKSSIINDGIASNSMGFQLLCYMFLLLLFHVMDRVRRRATRKTKQKKHTSTYNDQE